MDVETVAQPIMEKKNVKFKVYINIYVNINLENMRYIDILTMLSYA